MEFLDETVIDERAVRRLAARKGIELGRTNGMWDFQGVALDDDDIWSVLSAS